MLLPSAAGDGLPHVIANRQLDSFQGWRSYEIIGNICHELVHGSCGPT